MTDNDRGRPLDRRSPLPRCASFEGRSTSHKFLRNKHQEWEESRSKVTAYKLWKAPPAL
ncbi:glutamine synthetase [Streptomyces sp. NPDC058398]|uniref:glutamine synthetase n=1 Tax=Streptomyces sp. NPDC058398 TaxID=3346479 RepID=UPI003669AC16